MIFTVIGGDLRSIQLCRRLLLDGHEVRCFGLELGDVPQACRRDSLEAALRGTECVVLPIPAAEGSLLRTPYGCTPLPLSTVVQSLPRGVPVFGGGSGIPMTDLTGIESMAIANAALTAQGALSLILQHSPHSLRGHRVLILGGGRIGTLLGLLLQDVGVQVTVASRRESCRAWHTAMGMTAADIHALSLHLPRADVVVNTVPHMILGESELRLLREGCVLLELASLPGGFDPAMAEAQGIRTVMGRGLPGKLTPAAAADIIAETIYKELEL